MRVLRKSYVIFLCVLRGFSFIPMTTINVSRFDTLVSGCLLSLALFTALLVWRGDQIGATLIAVSPAHGAEAISTQADLQITFAQPMLNLPEPLTLSPTITGTTTWRGNTLTFRPSRPLQPDTLYTVNLADNLQSALGRSVLSLAQWQFRTRGLQIIYLAPDENKADQLFVTDISNTPPRQLTHEPIGIFDYVLSPSGYNIIYSAWQEDDGRDLWQVTLDGGEPRLRLDCVQAACNGVAWSPDGQRMVYEKRGMLVQNAAPGPPRLWWLNPSNGETVPVFEEQQILGYGASWSPDGQWLSYVAPASQGVQIYNVNDARTLLIPSRTGGLPVWSPVDNEVLVTDIQSTGESFGVHIFRAIPEKGQLTDISAGAASVEDSSPVWSPDGQWLAVARKAAGTAMGKQIWLIRPDGREAQALTNDAKMHHSFPTWSPDGRYLLFQRFSLKELGSQPSIWRLEVATKKVEQIVTVGSQPMWLP